MQRIIVTNDYFGAKKLNFLTTEFTNQLSWEEHFGVKQRSLFWLSRSELHRLSLKDELSPFIIQFAYMNQEVKEFLREAYHN